jgi:hypothetical protein
VRERRKAGRRPRQESERQRRGDRKRGGQPGHQGKGLARDPDPGQMREAGRPAQCRSCKARLDGAAAAGSRWAQVIDVEVIRKAAEWLLPGLQCPCGEMVTFAKPPPGAHPGSVSYGAVLNAAAVVLTGYGNVPPERAAQVMAMLLGVPVSPGRGGQGQCPAGGAAGQGRVRPRDARGAGRPGRAGRGRDPGQRAGQERSAARCAGGGRRPGPRRQGEGGCGDPARADRPDPGRAATPATSIFSPGWPASSSAVST